MPRTSPSAAGRCGSRRAAVVIVCVLAAGCAALVPPREPGPVALVARTPAAEFSVSGRIAARVVGEAGRAFSGGFTWHRRPQGDTIELLTPLGQLAARIDTAPGGARILLSGERMLTTPDPERYLESELGIALPLAVLPFWIQGVPAPGRRFAAEADGIGRLAALTQDGWQVRFQAYEDDSAAARPMRLQLTQGDAEGRIAITAWEVWRR